MVSVWQCSVVFSVCQCSVVVSVCQYHDMPLSCRDNRRNSAFALVAEPSPGDGAEAINEAFMDRPVTEAYNSAIFPNGEAAPTTPSVVSQKAAFFAQVSPVILPIQAVL